ncbi:MAG: nuclear transport factor 2 family protein [Deltaproteobacteria bacterium]|jgi:ketosteroid isomerase-like protein|nr:nuclear transport factor 2 family protein [Deltaproteobacteria bacterium]MBW2498693.1 nuclear transport factor 2 family protein [Deltaproteobacteria bacterium]
MTRMIMILAGLLGMACQPQGGLTAEEQANVDAVRTRVAAYNAQAEGWLEDFGGGLADDFIYQGYGPWAPEGMTADRDQLIEMVTGAAKAFPDRTTTIHNIVASGDTVVLETEWSGTASDQNPMLKPGERQGLREVLIHRFRDGKIVETKEYGIVMPAP